MQLKKSITINNKLYAKGAELPWYSIYPFFMLHMLVFGLSGFFMAYSGKNVPVGFLYAHGGFAIFVYTIFYLVIFGLDEVKWMFINAGLGILGVYTQIGWLLAIFGKNISDYPYYVHVIPFLYFILYTFLLRHAFLDILGARKNPERRKKVEIAYVATSVAISAGAYLLDSLV